MQVASDNGTGEALNVERCQCPRNYVGPSCEVSFTLKVQLLLL